MNVDGLRKYLRSSDAYDVVDDAVMGCLTESTAMEVMEDFGIPWTREGRRLFGAELDAAILSGEA